MFANKIGKFVFIEWIQTDYLKNIFGQKIGLGDAK